MTDVLIAPFSNSTIRDWPAEHFRALIGLVVPRLPEGARVRVVGTAGQRIAADQIVRPYPADAVRNDCGRLSWGDLLQRMKRAACLIGNNSGLSHMSGYFGTPTVCIFGGSHQRGEWGPLGEKVVILSRVIGCSPCQLDHKAVSPYNKACLREITPAQVVAAMDVATDHWLRPAIGQTGGT